MKKIIATLLVMSMLMCGCGGKPEKISDGMYESASYVVRVVDMYLDGEATIDETYEKIDALNIVEDEKYSADTLISAYILGIEVDVLSLKTSYGTADMSKLREGRDKLAKEINYKD